MITRKNTLLLAAAASLALQLCLVSAAAADGGIHGRVIGQNEDRKFVGLVSGAMIEIKDRAGNVVAECDHLFVHLGERQPCQAQFLCGGQNEVAQVSDQPLLFCHLHADVSASLGGREITTRSQATTLSRSGH